MKNNKQHLLTVIRIDMNLLKYNDEIIKKLFGKTYAEIAKLKYDDIKPIEKKLHTICMSSLKGCE